MSYTNPFIHSVFLILILLHSSCSAQVTDKRNQSSTEAINEDKKAVVTVDASGSTIETRFPVPEGYDRKEQGDYASYLRSLPLQEGGAKVKYYNGKIKNATGIYCAVLVQEISKRDLHQCADAIMNLYARFHFDNESDENIHFNFTNGWRCDYSKYRDGYRVSFKNGTNWYKSASYSRSEKNFKSYMTLIYSYCGTASLEKELIAVNDYASIKAGDVFIKGGHPGHAVMVMDVVENNEGDKQFLLGQSYMPAQQMQILINPNRNDGSPWYLMKDLENNSLTTPEWSFSPARLKRFSFK